MWQQTDATQRQPINNTYFYQCNICHIYVTTDNSSFSNIAYNMFLSLQVSAWVFIKKNSNTKNEEKTKTRYTNFYTNGLVALKILTHWDVSTWLLFTGVISLWNTNISCHLPDKLQMPFLYRVQLLYLLSWHFFYPLFVHLKFFCP